MDKLTPSRSFQVSTAEYPFEDRWLSMRDGYIHYVDEGQGPTVLLLHGNPTWSYLYRHVICELRSTCRAIALDYPGFGYSKAPSGYRFTPQEHAEMLRDFIGILALKDLILVVQDWGGPIGLSYAVEHRDNLRGLVVMNSWAWEASVPQKLFSLVMGGWPLGYWLQTRRNFFATSIVPHGIYHKEKVVPSLRKAYIDPFPTIESRVPTWVFPRQIRRARRWLRELEARLSRLADLPAQILWGSQDEPGFRKIEMMRWQQHLRSHETEVLDDASHFIQEDRPDRITASIFRVLERTQNHRGITDPKEV
jgi:haloalkane dehalogenase